MAVTHGAAGFRKHGAELCESQRHQQDDGGTDDPGENGPGPGQLRVRQRAAGINFIDVYFRIGMYPAPLPFVIGNEGAGDVVAVGEGVKDFKVGDRVAYVAMGSYEAERLLPADRAVKLPDAISYEQAAGMMLKGMTAQYLVRRVHKVAKGETILVHAAAGEGGYVGRPWEIDRVAILRNQSADPAFETIRSGLIASLYNQKEVWPIFGYEGESFSKGGYIHRGFDDITWL